MKTMNNALAYFNLLPAFLNIIPGVIIRCMDIKFSKNGNKIGLGYGLAFSYFICAVLFALSGIFGAQQNEVSAYLAIILFVIGRNFLKYIKDMCK